MLLFSPKLYWKDWWLRGSLLVSLGVLGLISWYTISRISATAQPIFLHYNIIFGVDLIGEWWKIYNLPIVGLGVIVVNFGLAYVFYAEDRLLARLLAGGAALVQILILIAAVFVVGLNV